MEDREIIALFWNRAETAIQACREQFGGYCRAIAARILKSPEDTEECLSDTWLGAWNAIPPQRPGCLRVFLGRITRNLALDRLRARRETQELSPRLPDSRPGPEELAERQALHDQLRRLVEGLEEPDRTLFLRYYYEEEPLYQVASRLGMNLSTAKTRLARGRKRLKQALTGPGGMPYVKPHP